MTHVAWRGMADQWVRVASPQDRNVTCISMMPRSGISKLMSHGVNLIDSVVLRPLRR